MTILYVGIDLAKNIFAVHAVNEAGKPELVRPNVARTKLLGHTVRLMAPKVRQPVSPVRRAWQE